MVSVAVLALLLFSAVSADISGTNPPAGTCLCFTTTGVNVRDGRTYDDIRDVMNDVTQFTILFCKVRHRCCELIQEILILRTVAWPRFRKYGGGTSTVSGEKGLDTSKITCIMHSPPSHITLPNYSTGLR